ncbi:hypothetical protein [Ramlibacter alkalitolerans]|uniref:Uncharacterized protein n=1 Tax=Ramlibacter alkalitolerans TaxID=2039631 RepID=A0ABS1JTX0_9BURK|nr:hypothetical protein [Ramlibacter alkalitolerans]MBL0427730.1 hypothetical protein [Ramlibacter alkalitolerans]
MSTRKRPPTKLAIGAYGFTVSRMSEEAARKAGVFGETDLHNQDVAINFGNTDQTVANTFLHEALHGVHWVSGLEDKPLEEEFTRQGANGICELFRRNPKAMAWWLATLDPKAAREFATALSAHLAA